MHFGRLVLEFVVARSTLCLTHDMCRLFRVLNCLLLAVGTTGSCEAMWMSNHSSAYGSSTGLSEPVNAYSSLAFAAFGLTGLVLHGHTTSYYTVMHLFILTGIGSFAHHWLYSDAEWAYQLDLVALIALAGLSLLYMSSGPTRFHRFLELLAISLCVLTLLLNRMRDPMWRMLVWVIAIAMACLQVQKGLKLAHALSSLHHVVIGAVIWSGVLAGLAVAARTIDDQCPQWVHGWFNGHSLWHVLISWALFNAVQVACMHDELCQNGMRCDWLPLFPRAPWLLFVVAQHPTDEPHIMHDKSTTALLLPTSSSSSRRSTRGHRRSATATDAPLGRRLYDDRIAIDLHTTKSVNNLVWVETH